MTYLKKDELDKYLKNLPRTNSNNQQASSTVSPSRPVVGGNLRGPRPAMKPASWRTSSEQSSNAMQDARNDLIYPMQKQLHLNDHKEAPTSSIPGIQPHVDSLQQATGTISEAVTETSKKFSSPLETHSQPSRVDKMDAFEASLSPRRRQQPTPVSPVTETTTTTAASTSAPPVVQPKPPGIKTKPLFSTPGAIATTNSRSPQPPPPPIPKKTSSPSPSPAPAPYSRSQPPPIPTKKPSTPPPLPSSSVKVDNDRVSVANPLYSGVRCAGCDKPIAGRVIRVDQNQWHVDCFKCKHCKQDLEHIAFYSMHGQPYCALDYHELFSKRCDYCNTPIEEKSIEALGKHYHIGHFFCRGCSKPFDETSSFMVHDGHPYCEKDYQAKFGNKCMGCGEYITSEFVGALGGDWHKECFVCADCGKAFESASFYERNNKPFCEVHYKNPRNGNVKVCQHCGDIIDGRYSSAFGKDYHPHHFQCARCNKILSARVPGMWQEGNPGELICKMCGRQ